MDFEVLSAEILNNETHTFTFSKSVDQFMVGFSKFLIEYPETDHHIQKIFIDLTDVQKNDDKVIISPKFHMSDSSNHNESYYSKITVVVLAAIGYKNRNIYMENGIKTNIEHILPLNNPTFIAPSLTYSSVQFEEEDHHLNKLSTKIEVDSDSGSFKLDGFSKIQDSGKYSGSGEVNGSIFIYNGTDHKVLGSNFTSGTEGNFVLVKLGQNTKKTHHKRFRMACFIDGFELSYKNNSDHHVKTIEVSCEIDEKNLIEDQGSLYAKVFLKSLLSDGRRNNFDVPHNTVSGFVVAFKNDKQ